MLKLWGTAGGRARPSGEEGQEVRLLALVAGGDRLAFQSLYRAYFPRLARFLDRMTRNLTLAEEIINDTMLVVWQKAESFDHSAKVSTWIFAIAYRQALKALRALDEPAPDQEMPDERRHQPERAMQHRQLQRDLQGALAALPFEQRMVVSLTYFHDMDYKEIAATMDCPVNTVKTRMFHARQRLKQTLDINLEEFE